MPAKDLRPNPRNWRTHPPAQQDALRGVLAEVGYADALLARELPDGSLELVDGHLRAETTPDQIVPVLVLDVTEAEAAKLLAVIDPLAAMATADAGKLDALMRQVETGSEELAAFLKELAEEHGIIPGESKPTELRPLDVKPPLKVTWVLLGIPTVRFGEIAEDLEAMAAIEGVFLETTSNDG